MIADRLKRPEWVGAQRARCHSCSRAFPAWQQVPVVSWLLLGGKCPTCKAPTPIRYPLIELATATVYAASCSLAGANGIMGPKTSAGALALNVPELLTWWLFWSLLFTIVLTDLMYMRVPNMLSLTGIPLVGAASIASGVQTWSGAIIGAAVGGGVMLALHIVSGGKMGMGDVKLYFVIGTILGPVSCVESLVFASFSGSIIGLIMRSCGLLQKRQYMPFVPHIAIGVVVAAFYGHAMTGWYIHQVLGLT